MGQADIRGTPENKFFQLHLFGGPDDGAIITSFVPYYIIRNVETGNVYEADTAENYIEWLDDNTRIIKLYYRGKKSSLH